MKAPSGTGGVRGPGGEAERVGRPRPSPVRGSEGAAQKHSVKFLKIYKKKRRETACLEK